MAKFEYRILNITLYFLTVKIFFLTNKKKNSQFYQQSKEFKKESFIKIRYLSFVTFQRLYEMMPHKTCFFSCFKKVLEFWQPLALFCHLTIQSLFCWLARTFLLIVQTIHATKGQLISKTIFLVLIWTKNQMKLFSALVSKKRSDEGLYITN